MTARAYAEDLKSLGYICDAAALVGSTFINGAGADKDILVLLSGHEFQVDLMTAVRALQRLGWEVYPSADDYGLATSGGYDFASLRSEDVNLLLVEERSVFDRWVYAAEVCRIVAAHTGGTTRELRVALHRYIMDEAPLDACCPQPSGEFA